MATRAKNRGESRPSRIPVSGKRTNLTIDDGDKDENFVYRWVNDTNERISRFQKGGYEFVQDDLEAGVRTADTASKSSSMVSKPVGQGITAYLMRIKKEWYEEDQNAKHKAIAEQEEDMKRTLNSGKDGTYGSVNFK